MRPACIRLKMNHALPVGLISCNQLQLIIKLNMFILKVKDKNMHMAKKVFEMERM